MSAMVLFCLVLMMTTRMMMNREAPREMEDKLRWNLKLLRVLVSSGTRLGQEYREAWEALKQDAEQCAEWVGEELEGGLAVPVRGAGVGCTTGATRKVVVEQMEKL